MVNIVAFTAVLFYSTGLLFAFSALGPVTTNKKWEKVFNTLHSILLVLSTIMVLEAFIVIIGAINEKS